MTLKIKHPEVNKLAQELAHTTGETVSEAIMTALRERLEREQVRQQYTEQLVEKLLHIGRECAALPLLDSRLPEDIIDYNQYGVPV